MNQPMQYDHPFANLLPVARARKLAQDELNCRAVGLSQTARTEQSRRIDDRFPGRELKIDQITLAVRIVEHAGRELDEPGFDADPLPVARQPAAGDSRCLVSRVSERQRRQLRLLLLLFVE